MRGIVLSAALTVFAASLHAQGAAIGGIMSSIHHRDDAERRKRSEPDDPCRYLYGDVSFGKPCAVRSIDERQQDRMLLMVPPGKRHYGRKQLELWDRYKDGSIVISTDPHCQAYVFKTTLNRYYYNQACIVIPKRVAGIRLPMFIKDESYYRYGDHIPMKISSTYARRGVHIDETYSVPSHHPGQ